MADAGKLNRRIIIGVMPDGFSEDTGRDEGENAFIPSCTVWANVKHVRGSEFFAAAAVQAEQTVTFTIRYRSEITTDNVIKYGDTLYNIRAINDPSEGHDIQIITAEAV